MRSYKRGIGHTIHPSELQRTAHGQPPVATKEREYVQSCTQWRGNVCSSRCAWRPTEIEREPKGIHNSEWYDIKTKLTPRIQRKYGLFSARHIACVFFVGPPRAFRAVRLLTFLVLTTTRTRTRGLHFIKDTGQHFTSSFHVFTFMKTWSSQQSY